MPSSKSELVVYKLYRVRRSISPGGRPARPDALAGQGEEGRDDAPTPPPTPASRRGAPRRARPTPMMPICTSVAMARWKYGFLPDFWKNGRRWGLFSGMKVWIALVGKVLCSLCFFVLRFLLSVRKLINCDI